MSDLHQLRDQIAELRMNPAAIQRRILDFLEKADETGLDLVDPTNPFIFLMEASVTAASASMQRNELLNRKQYPSLAQTEEELYLHMSDQDYIGRFATPARADSFSILLGRRELEQRVVSTGNSGIRKLVIPRNTEFNIAGYSFTMQYPVEIRIMNHGGIQVLYDVSKESPLQQLSSNVVEWQVLELSGHEWLKIDVPVQQFKISPRYAEVNNTTGFRKSYPFNDYFYYARVFMANENGGWDELSTTHSDQVYDPTTPTASLQVLDGVLNVEIPQIYFSSGQVQREVRVDIYTTKGPLNLILGNYDISAFSARWIDLDDEGETSRYSAPLQSYSMLAVFSDAVVVGGSKPIGFDELRRRVMNNAYGTPNLPITSAQLRTAVEDKGYTLVKSVDSITNRIFLASRDLPAPSDGSSEVSMGCSIETYQASYSDLDNAHANFVSVNGDRITLRPTMLYRSNNGVVERVDKSNYDSVLAMDEQERATKINNERYLFTPFHYVLDKSGEAFEARPYYLDAPEVSTKIFVDENDTTGLVIATQDYAIERVINEEIDGTVYNGYRFLITTRSGDTTKALADDEIIAQLSFIPPGENRRVYQNADLRARTEAGERIFEFLIETDYDINPQDELLLDSFQMFENTPDSFPAELVRTFDLCYYAKNYSRPGMKTSAVDEIAGAFLLPQDNIGLVREQYRLRLGYALHGLWSNTRSVVGTQTYQLRTADNPKYYENTVYQRDANGYIDITYDESTDTINYTVLHEAGDPVLDESGEQVYEWREGDIARNPDGTPIINEDRTMMRHVDMLFLDGRYVFATEATSIAYRQEIPMVITEWLDKDIASLSQQLLENTELYFYPRSTIGQIEALVGQEQRIGLDSEQSVQLYFYLTADGYDNAELRNSLSQLAKTTLSDMLSKSTISKSAITSKLSAAGGDDVVAVEMTGLGGAANHTAITMLDGSNGLTVKKELVVTPDGNLSVDDAIVINFVRHESS